MRGDFVKLVKTLLEGNEQWIEKVANLVALDVFVTVVEDQINSSEDVKYNVQNAIDKIDSKTPLEVVNLIAKYRKENINVYSKKIEETLKIKEIIERLYNSLNERKLLNSIPLDQLVKAISQEIAFGNSKAVTNNKDLLDIIEKDVPGSFEGDIDSIVKQFLDVADKPIDNF
jgi:hypothetical protein